MYGIAGYRKRLKEISIMLLFRNILIGIVLFFGFYFSLTHHFKVKRMLDDRKRKRIIDWENYKKGLKPEMRDSILKMR